MHWEDVCKWCEKAGEAINGIDRSVPVGQLRSAPALQFNSNSAEYGVRVMESAYSVPEIKQHAMGGIITSPTLSWVGEAGREAIIPLTKQDRGTQLWVEAGRELGVINNASTGDVISEIANVVNALKIQNWSEAQSFGDVSSRFSESKAGDTAIDVRVSDMPKVNSITPHATGGIFSQPHIGLIAEAGREAIIPLTKQDRGTQLWVEAGRELGVINNTSTGDVISDIANAVNALKIQNWNGAQSFGEVNSLELQKISNITPHAMGGIFTQPHIGLVAEAGREAIIPLTKQDRGAQLWIEAGRELGLLSAGVTPQNQNSINMLTQIATQAIPQIPQAASSLFNQPDSNGISLREAVENDYSFRGTTENNNKNSPQIVFSPNITVTVNGGSPEVEKEYRQMTEELFEEMFVKFQEKLQRVSFD